MARSSNKTSVQQVPFQNESAGDNRNAPRQNATDTAPDGMGKRLRSWLRAVARGKPDNTLKEALEEVLEEHEEEGHQLPQEEQNMLKNMLTFSDLAVRDIMTQRAEIKAVEYNTSLEELKSHITHQRHTRVPVYNDTLDNVKGFVHIKDLVPLLSGDSPFNMALILRDILFVPPSMKLMNLLVKMRGAGVHVAIVVDEYGGTDGLVTLEDLFEEIVGDIQDEHDEDEDQEALVAWGMLGHVDVDARIPIEKLDSELQIKLIADEQTSDFDSLGGYIFYKTGRVPTRGEVITHESGARFEILSADLRRIHRVRIIKAPVKRTTMR